MGNQNLLSEPLLSPNTKTNTVSHDVEHVDRTPNPSLFSRLLSLLLIGIISIWANYEASKGFDITIINDSPDSLSGKRFHLFYISNGKATRIVQNTSSFVENALYTSSSNEKKQVRHVTLRLANSNISNTVDVRAPLGEQLHDWAVDVSTVNAARRDEYVISISPLVITTFKGRELDEAISLLVLRGMARIWLWNGESMAPPWLVDAMVEYITGLAGYVGKGNKKGSCKFDGLLSGHKYEDPKVVISYLDLCERHEKGFIRRLNRVLKERWDDGRVKNMFETCQSIVTRRKGKC